MQKTTTPDEDPVARVVELQEPCPGLNCTQNTHQTVIWVGIDVVRPKMRFCNHCSYKREVVNKDGK